VRRDWICHVRQLICWESLARDNTKSGALLVVPSNSSGGLSAGEHTVPSRQAVARAQWCGLLGQAQRP